MSAKSLIAPAVITCIVLVATTALAEFVWKPGKGREKPQDPRAALSWEAAPRKKPKPATPAKAPAAAFSPTVRVRGRAVFGGSGLPLEAKCRLIWVPDATRELPGDWVRFTGDLDARIETLRPYRVEIRTDIDRMSHMGSSGVWSSGEPSWDDEVDIGLVTLGNDPRRLVRFMDADGAALESIYINGSLRHQESSSGAYPLYPGNHKAFMVVGQGNATHRVETTFEVGDSGLEVRMPPPKQAIGSIVVTVHDRHGCAMPTHDIRCERTNGEAEWAYWSTMYSSTDEQAYASLARFENLIEGRYRVSGISGNTPLEVTTVEVTPEQPHPRLDIRLPGPTLVRLLVTHHGKPAAGLMVQSRRDEVLLDEQGRASLLLEPPLGYDTSVSFVYEGHELGTRLRRLRQGRDNDVHVRLEEVLDPPRSCRIEIEFAPSASVPNPRDLDPYLHWSGTMGRWNGNTYTVHGLYLPVRNPYIYCRNAPGYRIKLPVEITSPGVYRARATLEGARIQANMDRATTRDPRRVSQRGFRWIRLDDDRPSWRRLECEDFMYSMYLAPGDYLVAAVINNETTAWQRIRIEDGKDLHIRWKLIEDPDELGTALDKALAED